MIDAQRRSLVKTVTWRLTGSGATFLVSYLVSGSWGLAGTIALIQLTTNTLLYYLHERIWNRIPWGRE